MTRFADLLQPLVGRKRRLRFAQSTDLPQAWWIRSVDSVALAQSRMPNLVDLEERLEQLLERLVGRLLGGG